MKMKHLIIAATVALVPATASLADKAAAEALKAKKEEAKKAAIEAAKEKAKAEAEAKAAANAKAAAAKGAKAADAAAASEEAKKAEEETHQKHLGIIERLEQVATFSNNAELKTKVESIKAKEDKRHTLAIGG
jgi:colicin import membrane protein